MQWLYSQFHGTSGRVHIGRIPTTSPSPSSHRRASSRFHPAWITLQTSRWSRRIAARRFCRDAMKMNSHSPDFPGKQYRSRTWSDRFGPTRHTSATPLPAAMSEDPSDSRCSFPSGFYVCHLKPQWYDSIASLNWSEIYRQFCSWHQAVQPFPLYRQVPIHWETAPHPPPYGLSPLRSASSIPPWTPATSISIWTPGHQTAAECPRPSVTVPFGHLLPENLASAFIIAHPASNFHSNFSPV